MAIDVVRSGGWVLVCAALLCASSAQAQGSDAEETAAARALFREGNRLLRQENWAEAADRFDRARELRQSPQITYNLTTALVELGKLVRASELLRSLENDEDTPRRVARAAARRREEIEPRIGRLTVTVEGPREDVALSMDEQPLAWAMAGVAIPADPGAHTVVATRDGEPVAEGRAEIVEGGDASVALVIPARPPTPEEIAAANPPEPEPEPIVELPPEKPSKWWIGLIVGVVAVGVGVGLGVGLTRDRQADPIAGTGGVIEFGGGS